MLFHASLFLCINKLREHKATICLDYVVSPSVVEMLKEEAERKQPILKSAGILRLSVNGTDIKPKVG